MSARIWLALQHAPGFDPAVAMAHIHRDDAEDRGGFNFDNVRRNEMLRGSGLAFKNAMKTGTTISGVCFAGGVVLGADTRSTNGETVADKNCEKIHYIAPNIYCCGAGTAADTEAVTGTCGRRVGDGDRRAISGHLPAAGTEPEPPLFRFVVFFACRSRAAPRERVVPRACRSFANTIDDRT